MEFRILGPLEVLHEGRALALGGQRQRALLALLLLHANEVVSADRLIEDLWGEHPPPAATNAVQVYVSRLRKVLGGADALVTRPPGYLLRVPADALDVHRFTALVAQARDALAAEDPATAGELLAAGLSLWRGPPLFDFLYESFAQAEVARLEELRLDALALRIEAELALGRHASVIGELESLVAAHPFQERLRAQLMLALYRSGRQADALEAYRSARTALVEELGLEPGPALQRLERAILDQDPQLDLSPPAVSRPSPAPEPLPPQRARRELRKTVTVLFTGITESGARREPLDPEMLHRLRGRLVEAIRSVVERHGGELQKPIGDALMAVFGIPVLHEDDALRAVRAAHELQLEVDRVSEALDRDAGVSFAARSAVCTGEVLAGSEGPEELLAGEVVGAAASLARSGSPGEILIGAPTYRLVRDWVTAEELDAPAPGGQQRAWRLAALEPASKPRTLDLRSPLVGRDRELSLLREAFERAATEPACHLVTLIGPAGVGKTRLARELLLELGSRARVLRGHCLPYGAGITFWPLTEIVSDAAALLAGDSAADAVARIAALVEGEEGNEVAERVAGLLGLTSEPVAALEGFWAVRRLLGALARERPLIVLVDDIHWAEPTLLDLLEHVVEWSHGSPIVVLCLARHELLDARPTWGAGRLNSATLLLEPLSESQSGRLIENLLGGGAVAAEARARIVDAAGGNPLFIEELLRALIEEELLSHSDGEWDVAVDLDAVEPPATIGALLAARLDRLSAGERTVIERGAVIGGAFESALVASLCPTDIDVDAELMKLARRELIQPDPSSGPRTTAFRFRHILIREVAYRSVPKALRAELHAQLAERLEHEPSGLIADRDEILGYHLEQACRYHDQLSSAAAAASLAARAATYLAAAGRRARAREDHAAAAGLLTRVWQLPHADKRAHVELLPELGASLVELGQFKRADAVFEEAIDAARGAGKPAVQWRAATQRVIWQMATDPAGRTEPALHEAQNAIAELTKLEDDQGLAQAWCLLGEVHNIQGRQSARAQAHEHAIAHARKAGDRLEEARNRASRGSALQHGTAPVDELLACSQDDLSWARAAGDRSLEASTLCRIGAADALAGRFEDARQAIADGKAICQELGLAVQLASIAQFAGPVELRAGDAAAAERELRAGHRAFEKMGERAYLSTIDGLLAHALAAQGDHADALRFAGLAQTAAALDDHASQILALSARARAQVQLGEVDESLLAARDAVALADSTDFLLMQADAYADLAEVLSVAGRPQEAAAAAAQAAQRYDAKGVAGPARRMPGGVTATPTT